MRAVRFAAALEFALDPETERGIAPALPSLAKVSKERISDELRKILATREPSRALAIAERTRDPRADPARAGAGRRRAGPRRARRAATPQLARWLARVDAAAPIARLGALVAELARSRIRRCAGSIARSQRARRGGAAPAQVLQRRVRRRGDRWSARPLRRWSPTWTDAELRRLLADVTRPHAAGAVALWRADGAAELADRAAGDPRARRRRSPSASSRSPARI